MENDLDAMPPAKRARKRFSIMLAHSDENGNTCSYDVWPYALAWYQLGKNPDIDATVDTWQPELRRLGALHKRAKTKYKGPLLRDPDRQKMAAEFCLDLKETIDAGDGGAVLDAVMQCAAHGLVIPAWLALAFASRHQAVVYGDARDWNDKKAFGNALPKGASIKSVRAEKQFAPWAYECAKRLLQANPKRPIDAGFYSEVAAEIGSSQTNVQSWIKKHVAKNTFYVPLAYFKACLAKGQSSEEAELAWDKERWEEIHRLHGAKVISLESERPAPTHKKSKRK